MKKTLTIITAIIGVALLGILFKQTMDDEAKVIASIQKRVAPEMAKCWNEVAEEGGYCELQIIYAKDGSPLTGKVIKTN